MENPLTNPLVFGFLVASGATILIALLVWLVGRKFRKTDVARKYALLVATGFSYGRFIGMEAISDPLTAGTTIGAATALAALWYTCYFRSRREAVGNEGDAV